MLRAINNRKAMIAFAIVVAFVAIVVPTCRMVGCSMTSGAMSWSHIEMPGLFGTCGGTWVTSTPPSAVVPASLTTLMLILMAFVIVLVSFEAPQTGFTMVRVYDSDPPPPPSDPRGERLRI